MKSCPYCYRLIPENADRCMFCGGEFPNDDRYHFSIHENSFAPAVCKIACLIQCVLLGLQIVQFFDLHRISPISGLPAIFTAIITAGLLLYAFLKQPIVSIKRELIQQKKAFSMQIQQEKSNLDDIHSMKNSLEESLTKNLAERKETYQQRISELDREWHSLLQAEKNEVENRLRLLQQIHISEGLEQISLDEFTFGKIDQHQINILQENGITSAAQIKPEILDTMNGLEESCRHMLLEWHKEIEKELITTQPSSLPKSIKLFNKENSVEYKKLILKQKNMAFSSYKEGVADINRQTTRLMIDKQAEENESKEKLEVLTGKMKAISHQIEHLRYLNFFDFVLSSIRYAASNPIIPKQIYRLILILMLFILPVLQIPVSIISAYALFE